MLRIFVSHAAPDKKYLDELLIWLRPLQEKYFLRVWFDHELPKPPKIPFPWSLFFRYASQATPGERHPNWEKERGRAHIYLFLTSHRSIASPHIEQVEIPEAVGRSISIGPEQVRIFPVPVTVSAWKDHSRIGRFQAFPAIFDKKRPAIHPLPESNCIKDIQNTPPGGWPKPEENHEDAWLALQTALVPIVEEMRRDLMETARIQGESLDDFFRHEKTVEPKPDLIFHLSAPGAAVLFAMIYMLANLVGGIWLLLFGDSESASSAPVAFF